MHVLWLKLLNFLTLHPSLHLCTGSILMNAFSIDFSHSHMKFSKPANLITRKKFQRSHRHSKGTAGINIQHCHWLVLLQREVQPAEQLTLGSMYWASTTLDVSLGNWDIFCEMVPSHVGCSLWTGALWLISLCVSVEPVTLKLRRWKRNRREQRALWNSNFQIIDDNSSNLSPSVPTTRWAYIVTVAEYDVLILQIEDCIKAVDGMESQRLTDNQNPAE